MLGAFAGKSFLRENPRRLERGSLEQQCEPAQDAKHLLIINITH